MKGANHVSRARALARVDLPHVTISLAEAYGHRRPSQLEVEGLKRPMPLFQCLQCGKRYVISFPMPVSLLETTPIGHQEFGIDCVYVSPCPDCSAGKIEVVDGDLLEQDVDVIVNA